ncbi:lytic transglycosylase domain-containing protein [Burkholderia sp. Ac-20353]|uniref:lytic transglycosylase domain-containing protein n=1 Tax=Burkholderia sp. Ac-20353 TaxID=2703894 RepID=UPI00197C6186|nr:lytic transglycosylase domain-containing protein [Burkholderia sp. Ac-20353]MBN3786566.1 lytic transglycosylase domain-containing protein [Burkholderia sp. Ac-20353]
MPLDFMTLAQQCAPQIAPITMAAIVRTESGFNPYAIGVVHGRLRRQPSSVAEAMATMRALDASGWNFSVGLAQVNRANWSAYGLTTENACEPCRNLAAGAAILQGCFTAARNRRFHAEADSQADAQTALRASLSCYASGNFSTGYRTGYVQRVVDNAAAWSPSAPTVPAITPIPVVPIDSATLTRSPRFRYVIRQPLRQDGDGVTATSPTTEQQREQESSAVVF